MMKNDVGESHKRIEIDHFVGWNNRESKSGKRMEPINGETRET